jgi:small GTP-binding protein
MAQICNYTLVKITLIGDTSVGKTALAFRLTTEVFKDVMDSTICMDFHHKMVEKDGQEYKLQIWDTAGQERFRSIVQSYFRSCPIALLCFSLDNVKSFENLNMWRETVLKSNPDVAFMLVGMKCDMGWYVEVKDVEDWAQTHHMPFIIISSKTGKGINAVVNNILQLWLDKQALASTSTSTSAIYISLPPPITQTRSSCC